MRPARRDLLVLGGAALAAAAAGALVGALTLQSRSGAAALLAEPFDDIHGVRRRLTDWPGRVLVCNFWATWCAPCREEIPLLVAAQQKYASKGVQFVGIGIDQVAKISEFVKEFRIGYPMLVAGGSAMDTMKRLGNQQGGLPFTAFLDRRGSLAQTKLGALRGPDLDGILVGLIG